MAANRDRFALIEQISSIGSESPPDLRETLDRIVSVIATGMEVEVCSLYLFDPQHERLVLRATLGLDRDSVGRVSMRVNEGLVGLAIELGQPVVVEDAISHPRYKYFPETGEERYHTFLGVPIQEGRHKPLGVLVAQTLRRRKFSKDEVRLLRTAASQVAQILSHFQLRETLATKEKERDEYRRRMIEANRQLKGYEKVRGTTRVAAPVKIRRPRLVGLPAAPGFARGVAHVVGIFLSTIDRNLRARDSKAEQKRLEEALARSRGELVALKVRMTPLMPEADLRIFDAHRLILEDEEFIGRIREAIETGYAAESALFRVIDEFSASMLALADGYLREKATDFRDVGHRVLMVGHGEPIATRDGHRVQMLANIALFADIELALRYGAEGVGLLRSEFSFLTYEDFPDEEQQLALYNRMLDAMGNRPVTIRTLDIGADKYPPYLRVPREDNPFLGWRSIRISLEMSGIFKVQLRAILRAAARHDVKIMFPMISSIEELRRARELLGEAQAELFKEGLEHDPEIEVGIMVEVPSAVWLAQRLIREVDFFSIGTNDLIQYLLAADRNNRKVAHLYEPLHPAVLSAIEEVINVARGAGKEVGLCGEMASDPMATLLLLGMGLDQLSLSPLFIPVVRKLIRATNYQTARHIAHDVMQMAS